MDIYSSSTYKHTHSRPQSTTICCFYLEAVFELLGDKVKDYGIDAGVDGCQVDAEVVEHQEETAITEEEHILVVE